MKAKKPKKISDLIPDEKNFNKHTEFGTSLLEKSLRKFGAGRSILIDKNNRIIAGNGITETAGAIGLEDVQVIETDGKRIIAVKRTDIDLNTKAGRELALADNATSKANLNFDEILIEQTLGEEILTEWGLEKKFGEIEEDNFQATPPKKPITKLGDVYELNQHRLMCGDSTKEDDVSKLMNGKKFDLLFTSPPYNQGNSRGDLFSHGKRNEKLYEDGQDNLTTDEYKKLIIGFLNVASGFVSNNHCVCINICYNAKSRDDYGRIIFSKENPFSIKESIVWNKGTSINLPQVGIYSRQCEFIYVMSLGKNYLTSQKYGDCRWNYWETKRIHQLENHKATFPVELPSKGITQFSFDGNIVYEPFAGYSTTLIASEQLNRVCHLMELVPSYTDLSVSRYIKFVRSRATGDLVIKRNGKQISEKEMDAYLKQVENPETSPKSNPTNGTHKPSSKGTSRKTGIVPRETAV